MIFHVTTRQRWDGNQSDDGYAPDAFEDEHFIHCCMPDQLEGVLHRYFLGKQDLIVLHIDPEKLRADVRYEPSTGGESFPHVYGRINSEAVVLIETLS